MKKILCLFMCLILIMALSSCGGSTATSSPAKQLTKQEFAQIYSDPEKYKGDTVDFYAKVFIEPEKDDSGIYLQCYAENDDSKNTIVAIEDSKLDLKKDDIIHVTGIVSGKFEGENAFGAKITAPSISASKVEKVDYATAFAPALKTIEVNKEINQKGYVIKLNKVEFSEKETRTYVTITNNSKSKINFYTFNAKVVQGNNQFETEDNYEANYPEIKSEILPGVKEDGVLVFKPIEPNKNIKFILEGSSENYDIEIKPFTFIVPVK